MPNGQQYPNNPDRVRNDMEDFIGVICHQPVREEVADGQKKTILCGGGSWVAEQLVIYGIHRFKKDERRFDRQFPVGFALRCVACGSVMEPRDIEATIKATS